MTLKFSLKNITDDTVALRELSTSVQGFTQIGASPTKAAEIGPRQSLDVWLKFKIGQCSNLDPTAAVPRVAFEYQVGRTWWQGSIMSPMDNWVQTALAQACP